MTARDLLSRLLAAFRTPKRPDPAMDEQRASERLYPAKCEVCGRFTKDNAAICVSCRKREDLATYWRAQ